ncbi:MAG: hypothetical protein NE327_23420 [Lentisphaeraceae bacterium]|nr:hypothetical protein [Lentisphaeraceae bacterium]
MLKLLILIAGIAFAYFQFAGGADSVEAIERAGKQLSKDMKVFNAKAASYMKQFRSVRSKQQYQNLANSYFDMQLIYQKEKFLFQEFDPGSSEAKKAYKKYKAYHKKSLQQAYITSKKVEAASRRGMSLVIHQPEKIGLTVIGPIHLKKFGYEYP